MKLMKLAAMVGVLATISTSSIATAEVTRASIAMPATSGVVSVPTGVRGSRKVAEQSNLLGAPLFLVLLGAVAVTIGTIVIVNNNNDSNGG